MIDITEKKPVRREAIASGKIMLKESTIGKIRRNEIQKGDVMQTSRIAGINAVKQTQYLIPHCHQIPIDFADFEFDVRDTSIEVKCIVKAFSKTGVEMEALVGVSIALNAIWDMIKYLEKDSHGQYPGTRIENIRVVKKIKGE